MAEPPTSLKRARFGVYEADLSTGELRRNGMKIRLQEQPFQVLAFLLERRGEVVSREELRQRLWPADTFVDFDHGLNTAINKLREALGDSASNPRFIETLARRGYRFIAPLEAIGDAGTPPEASSSGAEARGPLPAGGHHDLPAIPRALGRSLFALIQVMYLVFYLLALSHLDIVERRAERFVGGGWMVVGLVTAAIGTAIRLWLLSAVALDYRGLGVKFRRLFVFILPLDELWALSPFLIAERIGFGPAFAACAALLLVPFAQRTLLRMSYSSGRAG